MVMNKFLSLIIGSLLTSSFLHAETLTFSFSEETNIKHITAMLFDADTAQSVEPEQTSTTTFEYSVPLIGPETPNYALAYAITQQGNLVSSPALYVHQAETLRAELPQCETKLVLQDSHYEQAELFQALILLRQKRKEYVQKKIVELFPEEMQEKLTRLESNFGYRYDKPISGELPLAELIHRLEALNSTVNLYETHRK